MFKKLSISLGILFSLIAAKVSQAKPVEYALSAKISAIPNGAVIPVKLNDQFFVNFKINADAEPEVDAKPNALYMDNVYADADAWLFKTSIFNPYHQASFQEDSLNSLFATFIDKNKSVDHMLNIPVSAPQSLAGSTYKLTSVDLTISTPLGFKPGVTLPPVFKLADASKVKISLNFDAPNKPRVTLQATLAKIVFDSSKSLEDVIAESQE